MDNAVAPAVTTPAAVAPVPVPQVPNTPPQVNTNPTPTATTPESSSFQDSLNKAVSNPMQLGFGILTTAALLYAIYYFQYNIRFSKTFVKSVENKIDELDMKYADVVSKLNRQETTTPQQDILPQAFI